MPDSRRQADKHQRTGAGNEAARRDHRVKTTIKRAILIFTVALALIGVAGTPALAATADANLIAPCENGLGTRFDVGITVYVQTEQTYLNGFRVVWRVWGDDPSYDDLLAGPYTDTYRGDRGPSQVIVGLCSNKDSTFDEDIGRDEIYFGIRIFDLATGAQREVVESNRILGNF